MSSNLATSIPNQATDRPIFTDRTPPLVPDFMHWVLLIDFILPSVFWLGLMMCLIHNGEFTIHMSAAARSSCLCVPFSEKLDSLLAYLDNRCTMHGFWCDTREWACGDQNNACYYNITMLPGYKCFLHLALITISHSFTSSLRVFLSHSSLSHDGS
jgi:hypothetical protein